MLMFLLAVFFVLLDQVSKYFIINYLNRDIMVIRGLFYLVYTKNEGVAFSILTGKRVFIIIITLLILGGLIYYVIKNKKNINSKIEIVAFSMILGGSIGNLIDRVIRGYVVDFISIRIFNYHFPIFNVADFLICIGVCILLFISFRKERNL